MEIDATGDGRMEGELSRRALLLAGGGALVEITYSPLNVHKRTERSSSAGTTVIMETDISYWMVAESIADAPAPEDGAGAVTDEGVFVEEGGGWRRLVDEEGLEQELARLDRETDDLATEIEGLGLVYSDAPELLVGDTQPDPAEKDDRSLWADTANGALKVCANDAWHVVADTSEDSGTLF